MSKTTYYKATRPDGTDFHSGKIDYGAAYAAGTIVQHPDPDLAAGASRYLSVATVPTDCTGLRWPCRLFAVEAVGAVRKDGAYPSKRRVRALLVVDELESWQVFGPQGQYVEGLIGAARNLSARQADDQYAARRAAWDAAGRAARRATEYAARRAARRAAWDAAGDAAWRATEYAARRAAWDAAWDAAGYAAWDAAGEAAVALVVRDLIGDEFTQDHYDTLTRPWRTVVGPIHPEDGDLS